MRKLIPLIVVLVAAGSFLVLRPATANDAGGLDGVWRLVEVTSTNDEGTNTNPVEQPNLTIFTDGHYATLNVFGDEARAQLSDDPTDEQVLAAWRPFNANAGTYEVSGSDLTTTVVVAKSPNATANNNTNTTTFELDGDTLYRTFTNPNNGNTFRLKLVRVE